MKLNKNLQKYIEENIFPSYKKNDLGHNLDHIKYVIDRSLKFAHEINDINYDMVYTIAAYHEGKEKGIEQGEKENSIKIAKEMKKANKPINEIIQFTGLSQEEVDEL